VPGAASLHREDLAQTILMLNGLASLPFEVLGCTSTLKDCGLGHGDKASWGPELERVGHFRGPGWWEADSEETSGGSNPARVDQIGVQVMAEQEGCG
jgi:hypothetical protein